MSDMVRTKSTANLTTFLNTPSNHRLKTRKFFAKEMLYTKKAENLDEMGVF